MLSRAPCHILFRPSDIVDTITKSPAYTAETLLIITVLIHPIRVNFPCRCRPQFWVRKCPDGLWLFRTRKLRVCAVHHSVDCVHVNCLENDFLDQLFVSNASCFVDAVGNVLRNPSTDPAFPRSQENSADVFLKVFVVAAVLGVIAAALDCSNPAHVTGRARAVDFLST